MSSPSPTPDVPRHRLPTLFEVLGRRTLAPVDLYSFYIYMRDQQRSVDYLDFWLDVSQHMSLCRHYVRELRRSNLIETPDLDKASKRSSAGYDAEGDGAGPSTEKPMSDQRLSAFLRSESPSKHSPSNSHGSNTTNQSATGAEHTARPGLTKSTSQSPATGTDRSPPHASDSPGHTVTRQDLRASAQRILFVYLLPGSDREIILPQGILNEVTAAIEENGREDPEVFDAAKDYVFQAMERDAFPGFLRSKALGNVVPPSMMFRAIVGLISLFGALWTAFVLIFLDYNRQTRCWLILPFTIGVYALASHQYMLDPILALVGYSEYTFMKFARVNEPFVRKLLVKRSWSVLGVVVLIDAALCSLFIFVPGKRL
ncbi:regulator of G protein signaling superfamily [Eremomyces bilateralis CBS 781.70]|uniref:Regulator of G protein signaling superfamily n=1 Tax=Eremomyces bilateralis CBS 781.70 TaxID=1392243 RepID=A0A6G1G786_9PEZI|nr:regulator of G protein signaling superfamily [Eremomyces bilateralis CBS 781.70]KAF1813913.1 regulator of G protein signaling superfamily [Eremomyces bilateralis CBS 781.70]